jgi:Fe-S cluster assembly scaffold protein SufB
MKVIQNMPLEVEQNKISLNNFCTPYYLNPAYQSVLLEISGNVEVYLTIPGMSSQRNYEIKFIEENSSIKFYVLKLTTRMKEKVNFTFFHTFNNCKSNFESLIIGKKGSVNVKCTSQIAPDLTKNSTLQVLKGITLNEGSSIAVEPILEVYSKDVDAKHGASVGYIEKELLQYLQLFGIDINNGSDLILKGAVNSLFKGNQEYIDSLGKKIW